jgi:L-lactate dehydrogenase (cytochrome)
MTRSVNSSEVVNIGDLRRVAQHRVPKAVFDYLDGGAESEKTLSDNRQAFRDISFRPRGAIAVSECKLSTVVLGEQISVPFVLAPVGYSRYSCTRKARSPRHVPREKWYWIHSVDDFWAQTGRRKGCVHGSLLVSALPHGGRAAAEGAIERAQRAGYSALVPTVDTPVAGFRKRDPRNGMKELLNSPFAKIPYLPNILAHPRWLTSFLLDGGVPKLQNVLIRGKGPMNILDVAIALSESTVTWADLKWIREVWSGPIVVKGILFGDDARRAVDEGLAAVVVSNHGGRQVSLRPLRFLRTDVERISSSPWLFG